MKAHRGTGTPPHARRRNHYPIYDPGWSITKLEDHGLTTSFDHGSLCARLQPLDRDIYEAIFEINNDQKSPRPACKTEVLRKLRRNVEKPPFQRCNPDSFRKSVQRLKVVGLIYTDFVSTEGYYVARGSLADRCTTTATIRGCTTQNANLVALVSALNGLGEQVQGVHNPRLKFPCAGLYGLIPDAFRKKGITEKRLDRMHFELRRYANVVAYGGANDTVCVEVSSTWYPFPRGTLLGLRDILESIREQILTKFPYLPRERMPLVADWIVTQFEVNTDANLPPLSGKSFHVSFRDFEGIQHSLYVKDQSQGRVRLEHKETPKRRTFSEVMVEEARGTPPET